MEREKGTYTPFAKFEGPMCFGGLCSLCNENQLTVSKMSDKQLNQSIKTADLGLMKKKKPKDLMGGAAMAFTDQADLFSLQFEEDMTAKQKGLLMAAVFASDYMLYEKDGGLCQPNDKGGCTTTCWNCYCCGMVCPCQVQANPKREN